MEECSRRRVGEQKEDGKDEEEEKREQYKEGGEEEEGEHEKEFYSRRPHMIAYRFALFDTCH